MALSIPVAAAAGNKAKAQDRIKKPALPNVFGDLYPASPYDIVVSQPDGSKFKARLTNAEVGGALEYNGFSVTKRNDGWWVYATGRGDNRKLIPSSARVGVDPRPEGIAPGAGRVPNIWTDNSTGTDIRTQFLRQLQIASAEAQRQAAAAGEPRVFKFPVIMLATWWDEEAGQTSPQFQDGNTAEHFKKILDGFGGNPKGSVTEFYFENSYGQFLVQVDVYGPYVSQRSREDRCYYGGIEPTPPVDGDLDPIDTALGIGGGGAIGMAAEGVPQADPEVDFSQYDNDGDGKVDFTAMLHSGPDMAATGDPCHTWSHAIEATLGTFAGTPIPAGIPTNDGVTVDRLFTMPEIDLEIGVAAHEMAHALGEPDYYNPSYYSMGTGDWDVMAGGSWFGNPPGSNPTGFNPASRVFQAWSTPTIVRKSQRKVVLPPRELLPKPGYTVDQKNRNVVLVPTQWIKVGQRDQYGYVWTENDVYGLPRDGDKGFVVEGYYLENWSRTVNAPPIHPEMDRAPYFDRQALSSGLQVWHFDYFYRSNVYYGSNNAGSDPNRPQMDPVEFDYNDNTQELQLALTRGEPSDLIWGAATGITSGTRQNPPGVPEEPGEPQQDISFTGVTPPTQSTDHPFTVDDNPGNYLMNVSVTGTGDCTLQLLRVVNGKEQPMGGAVDSGFVGDTEMVTVVLPDPGDYVARVGDFAGCTLHNGDVDFQAASTFLTSGAGDTWSNWTQKPTGWAFTNVGPKKVETIDNSAEAPGPETIKLDVLKLGKKDVDVSPGYARPLQNEVDGRLPVNVGADNEMSVPIFNNGGATVRNVRVEVRKGSKSGALVAQGTIPKIAGYSRTALNFDFSPVEEGFYDLFVKVDPNKNIKEGHEGNNIQKSTEWAGPRNAQVLIVDDDGSVDSETFYAGILASLGIPYGIAYEHVDAATMRRYDAVIWEGGLERYQGQLNQNDRQAMTSYLNRGGKLLFSSPRAAAALGEELGSTNPTATEDMPIFLRDYFGALYLDTLQVGGGKVSGLGDILGERSFQTDVFPGRPLQDFFKLAGTIPTGQPKAVAKWSKGTPDALMATRVSGNEEHNNFKSVFLGFNLAQVVSTDDAIDVVADVMKHFGIDKNQYNVASEKPIIYHPQIRNRISGQDAPVKMVVLGKNFDGKAKVFYRDHGEGPYKSAPVKKGNREGVWQGTIPGKHVTPDGVDYYITAGSTSDPRAATGVVHAIGVGRPEVSKVADLCAGLENLEGNHIIGTDGNDKIRGTEGRDIICSFGGTDEIEGLGGNDVILGGKAEDTIDAGAGDDLVRSGKGSDSIFGGEGNDELRGRTQRDKIRGGLGNDYLDGSKGQDVLKGQDGNDELRGGSRRDKLNGGEGTDSCFGQGGEDIAKNCETDQPD